jgi:hypothetical protein
MRGLMMSLTAPALGVERISPRPNSPTATGDNANSVSQFGEIEAVTEVTRHVVDADHAEEQSKAGHQQCADERGRRHIGKEDQPKNEQGRVFRRSETERDGREWRRDDREHQHAERSTDP